MRFTARSWKFTARALYLLLILAMSVPSLAYSELISRDGPLLTVRETAEASLGEGTKTAVKEKARLAAIRKAIEENAGVVITAQSSMKNFALSEDVVSSFARVYIKSIREINYSYDSVTEKGIYTGEFVIDTSSLAKMAEAERALATNRNKPVEAGVFLFDSQGKMIADGGTVRQGQQFNLMLQPAGQLNAYIINRDSRGKLYRIFPNRDVTLQGNPLRGGRQYYFPPRESDAIFSFDAHPGRETFFILLSAAPLADLDALFSQLEKMQDSTGQEELAPVIQERIASRGIRLTAKTATANLTSQNGNQQQLDRAVGELLKGTGAFVKTIVLHHAQ